MVHHTTLPDASHPAPTGFLISRCQSSVTIVNVLPSQRYGKTLIDFLEEIDQVGFLESVFPWITRVRKMAGSNCRAIQPRRHEKQASCAAYRGIRNSVACHADGMRNRPLPSHQVHTFNPTGLSTPATHQRSVPEQPADPWPTGVDHHACPNLELVVAKHVPGLDSPDTRAIASQLLSLDVVGEHRVVLSC